jgi:enoyl-CoA hydratase/carnithine racemase
MEAEFEAAVSTATGDDKVRCLLITGSGRGFCAGADMSMLKQLARRPEGDGKATRDQPTA